MEQLFLIKPVLVLLIIVLLTGCSEVTNGNNKLTEGAMEQATFFVSPKAAVSEIRALIKSENWLSLARYYDLSGTDIEISSLVSGDFFIQTERPEVAHPGDFWRYKHPFPPAFEYAFATKPNDAGILTVRVTIRIDQGSGQPVQEGWQEFKMRQSDRGFQILAN